jgi:hypothetical protein
MLQEGNIKSASNKARIAEYQTTIHYLQIKIDLLDRENKVWDLCSIDEMSMSRDGYYADFGNDEESKDSEEKISNGFHGDSKHQIRQTEDIYTGIFTGMEEEPRQTEEACSDKTSSSGSKDSASQRSSGKWHRLLIKLVLNRKQKENPGSFFYR